MILHGDCLDLLPSLDRESVALLYLDPPFNTGTTQARQRMTVTAVADGTGDRTGFAGRRYDTSTLDESPSYEDQFDTYIHFLLERIDAALPVLREDASIFLHLDWREVHYVKVALDNRLGREHFMNEIIWAYDYGGRSKKKWPTKHDTILWYVRNCKHYTFNYDAMERIPYMAPGLVGEAKAARGKTPTDVWWHTIVPTSGREKTGYPTQKPLGVLRRIISVHSNPGDLVVDPFAGSGTTGAAAAELDRRFVMMDRNDAAINIMEQRLGVTRTPTATS